MGEAIATVQVNAQIQPPLRVGDWLGQAHQGDEPDAYCGGWFGRDSYSPKRVEAMGADWVVARTEDGTVVFADCTPETLVIYRRVTPRPLRP
jgi:hypothetical protein